MEKQLNVYEDKSYLKNQNDFCFNFILNSNIFNQLVPHPYSYDFFLT